MVRWRFFWSFIVFFVLFGILFNIFFFNEYGIFFEILLIECIIVFIDLGSFVNRWKLCKLYFVWVVNKWGIKFKFGGWIVFGVLSSFDCRICMFCGIIWFFFRSLFRSWVNDLLFFWCIIFFNLKMVKWFCYKLVLIDLMFIWGIVNI